MLSWIAGHLSSIRQMYLLPGYRVPVIHFLSLGNKYFSVQNGFSATWMFLALHLKVPCDVLWMEGGLFFMSVQGVERFELRASAPQ